MSYHFENHSQNVCDHHNEWEILGTGGNGNVGVKKYYFYNIYYCPLCKKVYYEDCHFRDLVKVFYSKKATCDYLIDRNISRYFDTVIKGFHTEV